MFLCLHGVLVTSQFRQEHHVRLRQLFQRLKDHGLTINLAKCHFGIASVNLFEHQITQQGAVALSSKVDAIRKFPKPTTLRRLQEFAGMIMFYHSFVPAAAKIMQPLFKVLANKLK